MSDLWICRKQTAKRPFRLEGPDMNLWTVEELCWYLYHNLDSMEESLMEEPLFLWLAGELKLPMLADSLRQQRKQGKQAIWCAWFLLEEIGMYSEEELLEYREYCQAMEHKGEFECQKLKVDRMIKNRRYQRGIEAYRKLLDREEADAQEPWLLGDIWHNLGVAYTGLFLFEEAEASFRQAYKLNGRQESLQAAEDAVKLASEDVQADMEKQEEPDWDTYLYRLQEEYIKKVI